MVVRLIFFAGLFVCIWGAYKLYAFTHPEPKPDILRQRIEERRQQKQDEQRQKALGKPSVLASQADFVVLAVTDEWLQVEAWGIVRRGGRVPGSVLLDWRESPAGDLELLLEGNRIYHPLPCGALFAERFVKVEVEAVNSASAPSVLPPSLPKP